MLYKMSEKDKRKKIPIIFAVDDKYCGKLAVVIISILLNSKSSFDFYVLSTEISEENERKLNSLIKKYNKNSELRIVNPSNFIKDDLSKMLSKRKGYDYISIETYYRFFIHKVLPEVDKAIYLDADLLVLGDISEVYGVELGDAYAGVVIDIWIHLRCQEDDVETETRSGFKLSAYIQDVLGVNRHEYFNAGVLVLNLKKLRDSRMDERLLLFTKRFSPLEFQDQDALNACFAGKVIFLDLAWNLVKDAKVIERNILDVEFQNKVHEANLKPKIIHYTGKKKPWIVNALEYDYIKEWWGVYLNTGYANSFEQGKFESILRSEKLRRYTPYLLIKCRNLELIHIYRENFRYCFVLFGRLICRKTIRI